MLAAEVSFRAASVKGNPLGGRNVPNWIRYLLLNRSKGWSSARIGDEVCTVKYY